MNSVTTIARPKLRRRWLRFSVRGLLLAVTVFCVWLGWHVNRSNRQKDAAAAIREAGGKTYQYGIISDRFGIGGGLSGARRAMIQRWFNHHIFYRVKAVGLGDAHDLSRVVAELHNLPDLEALWIEGKAVEDRDVARIAATGIWQLSLAGTDVDDDDLIKLRSLENLEALCLSETQIGNATLAQLSTLPKLRHLELDQTGITDEGLRDAISLAALRWISLRSTAITDVGLNHLGNCRQLTYIQFDETNVTDEGLARLRAALPNARINASIRNPASDAGQGTP
jgi:hypothetical protein